jgi:hypothetical protein
MPTAEGHVRTARPSRYLVQLCRHADHMRQRQRHLSPEVRGVEWSETEGTVELDRGSWTLVAAEDMLSLRVEAASDKDLDHVRSLLTDRLEQLGRRDRLAVSWHGEPARPRRRRAVPWVIVAVVVVVVAAHLGLGGAALAASPWIAVGLGALLVLKLIAVLVLGRHTISRFGHRRPRDAAERG